MKAVTGAAKLPSIRAIVVLVAALAGVAVTARLGAWQLSRAEQKTALRSALEQRAALPEIPADALARTPAEAQAQLHRRVRLKGRWLDAHTVYLDNRQMNGAPGFYVVTPLALAGGDAVLVQRGWVPRNVADRSVLPPVATAAGPVEIRGRIAPSPARLYEFSRQETGAIRQNLDIDGYSRETGISLRPVSVQQLDVEGQAQDGLSRQWPRPELDVHKHHGYAFQWFALSALISGLYVWFQLVVPWLGRSR